jgi:predicted transcriptional regulator
VRDALPNRKLAYTTVLTTLRNLEKKGYLEHEVEGRAHVDLPAIEERAVERSSLMDLLDREFDGSRVRLVDALLDGSDLSDEEVEDLRRRIEDLREEEGSSESFASKPGPASGWTPRAAS